MFVGSGPGDPGLLTARARTALTNAALVFVDPDVPEAVLGLVGTDLPPIAGPVPPDPKADKTDTAQEGAADAEDAAATVLAARHPSRTGRTGRGGQDPDRRGALRRRRGASGGGDPLSVDSVITEVNAVARTTVQFEIVPGLPATSAVPTYAACRSARRTPLPTSATRTSTGPPWLRPRAR